MLTKAKSVIDKTQKLIEEEEMQKQKQQTAAVREKISLFIVKNFWCVCFFGIAFFIWAIRHGGDKEIRN